MQPFYLAAHLVALRLFIAVFARKYAVGLTRLELSREEAIESVKPIVGLPGMAAAAMLAAPFCYFDFVYLLSRALRPHGQRRYLAPYRLSDVGDLVVGVVRHDVYLYRDHWLFDHQQPGARALSVPCADSSSTSRSRSIDRFCRWQRKGRFSALIVCVPIMCEDCSQYSPPVRASAISFFISLTLSARPMNTASPTRKWPIFNSASCGMAATGCTL